MAVLQKGHLNGCALMQFHGTFELVVDARIIFPVFCIICFVIRCVSKCSECRSLFVC